MRLMTVIAMVCAALACGCASVPTEGFEVAVCEGVATASVRIDDRHFAQRFCVESALVRREASGFAVVQIQMRNTRRDDVPIQYKFTFFDADGMEIQPGVRAWEQSTLHGGESVSLASVAPEKTAVRFVLRVRRVM